MPSPDILEQGQRRREEDKLHDAKKLQDRQHKLNLERDKKALRLSIIAILIALLSLLFSALTYFDSAPENTNTIQSIQAPSTEPANTNQ